MTLPTTQNALYQWNAGLLIGYVLVAFILDIIYRRFFGQTPENSLEPTDMLFNGATFSASVVVGMGIIDPAVLKVIGDTTSYLILAGAAGLLYSLKALTFRS